MDDIKKVLVIADRPPADTIHIYKHDLVDLSETPIKDNVSLRTDGNLQYRAYYLTREYDWSIVRDNMNEIVLMPVRKKGKK